MPRLRANSPVGVLAELPQLTLAAELAPITQRPATFNEASSLPGEERIDRLRSRLMTFGSEALADDELLEVALYPLLDPEHRGLVSMDLIRRFGSAAATMAASRPSLKRTEGLTDAGVAHLKAIRALSLRMLGSKLQTRPLLNNRRRLMRFFSAAFGFESRECLVVMYTDVGCRMITYDLARSGTVNHITVYPREIIRRALENGASGLIIVHNHPSGDPTPSADDLALTRTIADACALLDMTLHDHFIVASGREISFKELNLI